MPLHMALITVLHLTPPPRGVKINDPQIRTLSGTGPLAGFWLWSEPRTGW
jgi:hypothetical protein